jgi:hypothetical protein
MILPRLEVTHMERQRIRRLSFPPFEYDRYTEAEFETLPQADQRRDRTGEIPEEVRAAGSRYLLVIRET